jgi:hypothetical protein
MRSVSPLAALAMLIWATAAPAEPIPRGYAVDWSLASDRTAGGLDAAIQVNAGGEWWEGYDGEWSVIQFRVHVDADLNGEPEVGWFDPAVNRSTLRLGIQDGNSGEAGSVTFTGGIEGTITLGDFGDPWRLVPHLKSPATQTLTLGRNMYAVTFRHQEWGGGIYGWPDMEAQPPPEDDWMWLEVAVTSAAEPATLTLAAVGAVTAGAAAFHRVFTRKHARRFESRP